MPQPLMSDRHLLVVPNPFAAPLSPKGFPVAVVAFDPEHAAGPPRYIGARFVREIVEKRQAHDGRKDRRVTTVAYDLREATIVDSAYHRRAISTGELLPADESTAKRCGIKTFVAPAAALEAAKTQACAAWSELHEGDAPPLAAWFQETKVEGAPTVPPVLAHWPGQTPSPAEGPAGAPSTAANVDDENGPASSPAGGDAS